MRIAVCEDETIFRKQIIQEIEAYFQSYDVIIDAFSSGEELIKKYLDAQKEGKFLKYDLLFLDIEMKAIDGFETAKKVRSFGGEETILFLTSHTEFAMKGYEVAAFRFLAKPLEREKLREALGEFQKKMQEEKYMVLHTLEKDVCVSPAQILFVEAMKNYVYYCVTEADGVEQIYKVRDKIANVEEALKEEGFFRCHRSYLVQLQKVISYNNKELVMKNGACIPISRGQVQTFKEALMYKIME